MKTRKITTKEKKLKPSFYLIKLFVFLITKIMQNLQFQSMLDLEIGFAWVKIVKI